MFRLSQDVALCCHLSKARMLSVCPVTAGQLAGALYGATSIPEDWLAKLAWRDRIEFLAYDLFDHVAIPE